MNLSSRQQRLLWEIDDAVSRSDPRLASLLAMFGQLTAGEEMPGREQLRTPPLSRVRAALLAAAGAAAALTGRAVGMCAHLIGSAVMACTALAAGMTAHCLPAGRGVSPGPPAAGARRGRAARPAGPAGAMTRQHKEDNNATSPAAPHGQLAGGSRQRRRDRAGGYRLRG